jgi:uncharacterized membrane protein YqjE
MDDAPPTEGGVLSAATRLLKTLHDVVENRVELFLVELKEQRVRLFDALLLAAAGIVCGLMTLVMATLVVLVEFWDTHRLLVLTLITLAYAIAATVAFMKLRLRLQRWQAYTATLNELKKDCECLKKPN